MAPPTHATDSSPSGPNSPPPCSRLALYARCATSPASPLLHPSSSAHLWPLLPPPPAPPPSSASHSLPPPCTCRSRLPASSAASLCSLLPPLPRRCRLRRLLVSPLPPPPPSPD
eukprot:2770014-Prymnesium_polylepis.1